ncbi:MAG: type II toxin-antitoxin system VapC family toxin [Candidatus Diapherotrites archaeon]|nr:type II toxin-antitoxin system VapC family toxin [Candidatus Diapherotrites archaeon]
MTSQKVLVYTNIFLDYYFDRKSGLLPIGEFAFNFIKDTLSCKYEIIYCEVVLRKLKKNIWNFSDFELTVLSNLRDKNKLVWVNITNADADKAKMMSLERNIPFNDALIALLAKREGATVVTRDNHFFENLGDIVEAFLPEELR